MSPDLKGYVEDTIIKQEMILRVFHVEEPWICPILSCRKKSLKCYVRSENRSRNPVVEVKLIIHVNYVQSFLEIIGLCWSLWLVWFPTDWKIFMLTDSSSSLLLLLLTYYLCLKGLDYGKMVCGESRKR